MGNGGTVAFPRLLADAADVRKSSRAADTTSAAFPHVRDAASAAILTAIQRDTGYRVALSTAMQVPAFVKAHKTYAHTIASFPLRETVGRNEVVPRLFLSEPSEDTTYWSTMTRLVADLLNYDVAYWRIRSRSWDGFPSSIERMPFTEVSPISSPPSSLDEYRQGAVYWNGAFIPARDVIRFDGDGYGGWLSTGATAVNTAAALEAATMMYAEYPLPQIVLRNTGADLPAESVDALLDAWETARAARATAYVNSTITLDTMGWNAADLQLTEAKQNAAIQVARLANLDPTWVGAGVPGGSLTYSNRIDLYRQLVDLSLAPVMAAISQRLSANDITPRGHVVRFDTTTFLRGNPADMAALVAQLLPLAVITTDEARTLLDLPNLGVTL